MLAHDARMALRTLWTHRGFTIFATLSLALGIGANTALFSLVDGLLLRSLPVREPARLVEVQQAIARLGIVKPITGASPAAFDAVRSHPEIFEAVVGFDDVDRSVVTIDGVTEPERQLARVSADFFAELGIAPRLGRVPSAADDAVIVISDAWWRDRFDARPDALGRSVMVNGQAYTVIGVAPPRFRGMSIDAATDAWIVSRTPATLRMLARLAPGVDAARGRAAAEVVFRQLAETSPDAMRWSDDMHTTLVPAGRGLSRLRDQYERPLLALSALVVVVLLVTCTNVGNLLVVRNAGRRRELAVRVALGAGRGRLLRMYAVESLVLAVLGGGLALALAAWGVSMVLSMLPVATPPDGLAFRLDARVLAFATAASLVSAFLFGLAPAWRASAGDLSTILRAGTGRGATQAGRRLGRWLVACQVALSVLLLVAAGLFVQTLRNLARVDIGFAPDGLLQVSLDTRGAGYGAGQVGPLQRQLLDRVAAVPGVRSVTAIRNGVMQSAGMRSRLTLPGRPLAANEAWNGADVGPAFFETMAIPVLRGRAFTAADFAQGRRLVTVNESWARRYFPGENPVGALIGDAPQREIVGVVADTRSFDLRTEAAPTMYFMLPAEPDRVSALEIRARGDVTAIARDVQAEIRRVNPRLVLGVRTMRQEMARTIAKERLVAATSTGFGLLGMLLAAVGIFGVAASTVAQRTSELGIRMALGAGRWAVIREALRETIQVFAAGLAAGLVAAVVTVRLVAALVGDLLFGLTATDTATVIGSAFVMLAVALAACLLPVRRAVTIDPLSAIREP
jgi:putative ABC transport system permease protein